MQTIRCPPRSIRSFRYSRWVFIIIIYSNGVTNVVLDVSVPILRLHRTETSVRTFCFLSSPPFRFLFSFFYRSCRIRMEMLDGELCNFHSTSSCDCDLPIRDWLIDFPAIDDEQRRHAGDVVKFADVNTVSDLRVTSCPTGTITFVSMFHEVFRKQSIIYVKFLGSWTDAKNCNVLSRKKMQRVEGQSIQFFDMLSYFSLKTI